MNSRLKKWKSDRYSNTIPLCRLGLCTLVVIGSSAVPALALDPLFATTFITYSAAGGGFGPAVADLNGDQVPDVVTTAFPYTQFSVRFGTPEGTLSTPTTYSLPSKSRDVAIADLNSDGYDDLAIPLSDSSAVSIWLGNGDGTFSLLSNSNPADSGPFGIAVGQLDNDGILDIAVANSSAKTVSIIHGNGDGTFGPKTSYVTKTGTSGVVIGDLNNDTYNDLIVISGSGYVSVLLNNGNGGFGPRQDTFIGGGNDGALADVNSDGKADLLVANSSGTNYTATVLLGRGDGTFQPKTDYPVAGTAYSICVADIDSNGILDLVTIGDGGHFTVWSGLGNGMFANRQDYVTDDGGHGIDCQDLDGDSKLDAIVAASSGVSVSYNQGDGTFGGGFCYSVSSRRVKIFGPARTQCWK